MGYTSVRGGLAAIEHAEQLVADAVVDSDHTLGLTQVRDHLEVLVDQVMGEGGLYDRALGALAVKQAEGDPLEAGFLLRAYRTTLPRLGYSLPARSDAMRVLRRISSAFRDIPGGQVLGKTRDYSQRLLDFSLREERRERIPATRQPLRRGEVEDSGAFPLVVDFLRDEGLLAPAPERSPEREPFDVTREPLRFPAPRSARLQVLARGETGAMLSLAYAGMRGYGGDHGTIGELRGGDLPVTIAHPITGRDVRIGWVRVTEVHQVNGGKASKHDDTPDYSLGYGGSVGRNERKAISMSIIDSSLRKPRMAGVALHAIEDEEYVLHHIDSVEAMGFVEHLKLPHYVTFVSSLARSRRLGELVKAARTHA